MAFTTVLAGPCYFMPVLVAPDRRVVGDAWPDAQISFGWGSEDAHKKAVLAKLTMLLSCNPFTTTESCVA
jgi:hypothetical protein